MPLAPPVTVSQVALLVAVQAHDAVVVTLTVPPPPLQSTTWLVGVML